MVACLQWRLFCSSAQTRRGTPVLANLPSRGLVHSDAFSGRGVASILLNQQPQCAASFWALKNASAAQASLRDMWVCWGRAGISVYVRCSFSLIKLTYTASGSLTTWSGNMQSQSRFVRARCWLGAGRVEL